MLLSADSLFPILESDPALFDVQTTAAGPAGDLPLTARSCCARAPSGDLFGWDARLRRRHGLEAGRTEPPRVLAPEHVRRRPQPRRHTCRHSAITPATGKSGPARQGGRGRIEGGSAASRSPASAPTPARRPFRRAAPPRHDGQPALPHTTPRHEDRPAAADPLAADAAAIIGVASVTIRPSGHADGDGGHARSALYSGTWRRDAAAERGRGRRQDPDHRRPFRARPDQFPCRRQRS